jgi:hypothetical protein
MKKRQNIIFTIAIDNYKSDAWDNLNNAVLDCKTLTDILISRYSFEAFPYSLKDTEATKSNIYNSFNTLNSYICEGDNIVIFFAGHGQMHPVTKRGYWMPHDATSDISTWIENTIIKDFIHDLQAHHVWLIMDSCFSGTFLTKNRGYVFNKTYEEIDLLKSRWMLSSGSEEKVSDGKHQNHSPFCKFLIKYLQNNSNIYTSVSEISKYVKSLTIKNSKQTPLFGQIENIDNQGGEMVFILKTEYIKTNIQQVNGFPNTVELKNEYFLNKDKNSTISVGKEVLLVQSFIENVDFLIVENFRFDDENNKKFKFKDDKVIIQSKDEEITWTLKQRFATVTGLERYLDLEENQELLQKRIAFIPAHEDIDSVEEIPICITHSEYLQELLDLNKDNMLCLHCGEKISTNDCYLIEIDDLELGENIGNVHKNCLRPTDRIIGQSGYQNLKQSNLESFDFAEWINLLKSGQGQLKSIYKNITGNPIMTINWNSINNINEGKYCIKAYLENGDFKYVMLGKSIHRFTEENIDDELLFFNNSIKKASPAMNLESKIMGFYDYLNKIKKPNETILRVTKYEKALYSKQLEQNNFYENDYTPLSLVV